MPAVKTVLIIVDVQNDFLPPNGTLAIKNGLDVLPELHELLSRDEWDYVVASQDWHPPHHVSFASSHPPLRPFQTKRVPAHVLGPYFTPDEDARGASGSRYVNRTGIRNGNGNGNADGRASRMPDGLRENGNSRVDGNGTGDASGNSSETITPPADEEEEETLDLMLWPDHCVENTFGSELEISLKEDLRNWHQKEKFLLGFDKSHESFSAFSSRTVTSSTELTRALSSVPSHKHRNRPLNLFEALSIEEKIVMSLETAGLRGKKGLGEELEGRGVGRVVVVGLATDYCVLQTALSAASDTSPSLSSPSSSNPSSTEPPKSFQTYLYTPAIRGVDAAGSERAVRRCKEAGVEVVGGSEGVEGLWERLGWGA